MSDDIHKPPLPERSGPIVSLIAAVAENGVIGRDGDLPWHLPHDFKWFKKQTENKPVIMGRKTYESLDRPLVNRPNIVVTRQENYTPPKAEKGEVHVHNGLAEAIVHAHKIAKEQTIKEIQALERQVIDRIYLTEVKLEPEGDTYFPNWRRQSWHEIFTEEHKAVDDRPGFTFHVYERNR
mgnify:CR=1 FL=1